MSNRSIPMLAVLVACGGSPHHTPPPPPPGGGGAATGSAAPAPIDESAALALDPSIRHGVLANGLTYYVKSNKQPEKRVQLWLAVKTGSLYETDEQRGLAHMIEHLAFEGTKRFPKHDIQDFIERSGMKFGADLNAYTSFDETVYQLTVPSDSVGKGLDVLRDWAADVSFDAKEVVDERKIIEEERRFRNNVGFRMLQQTIPVEFQGSRYATRMPIGTPEVITSATDAKLRPYYASWYRPELMAVIVVGDVDATKLETDVKAKFADVPAKPGPKTEVATIETKHPPRFVVARDKENAVYTLSVVYQFPHRPEATPADLRRSLVEALFAHILSERLSLIAKRSTSPWTGAQASFRTVLHPVDEFALDAAAKDGTKVKQTIADLATELSRVRQHGFGKDEIEQGRASLLLESEAAVKELDTRESAPLAQEILGNFLTAEAVAGAEAELALVKRYLPTITNAELVALAGRITEAGRVVVVRAPDKGAVPTEKDVNEQIAGADKPVGEWAAIDISAPLIAAEPASGKVTAEKALAQGVTMWTLSNGARVFLKQTPFKHDEVLITAVSGGGTSLVKDKDYPQAKFAAQVVETTGVGNYGTDELRAKLAGKKVALQPLIDGEQERISAECSPDDVEPTLQLMYAAFTAPRHDEAAFAAWKAQQTQVANFIGANAQAKFVIETFNFMFNNSPRIPLPFPTAKAIETVTLDGAIAQYKARFANAADFDFVVIGAFDAAKIKPLVERYLASLPGKPGKREQVADVGLRAKTGKVGKTIKAGAEDKSMSFLLSWAPQKWSAELDADSQILRNVLDIELVALLREKLGGTYTVNVQAEVDRNPPQGSMLIVLFESAPGNAKSMQDETWKGLDKLATSPIGDDTLAKAKEQLKKSHDAELNENDYWRGIVIRHARYGEDLDQLVSIDRVLARATKDQVQKTARIFADKTNRATMTLLPEK